MSETFFKVCCPSCETVFEVTDSALIGQIVACPKCGGMILIEDPDALSPREESVQDQRLANVSEEVVPPPVVSDDVVPPPLPEVDEHSDDVDSLVGAPKSVWRTRLVLVLAGAICALLVAWATQFLSKPHEEVASQPSLEANVVGEPVDVPQDQEDSAQESVESPDDEEEKIVFTRDDEIETNEEFDARYAVELDGEETESADDASSDDVLNEVDGADELGEGDASGEGALDLGELEQEQDAEDDLDEPDAISTEFDEEEFERANKGDEENASSDDEIEEEEDLGSVASTTDVSLQSSLPTLKQAAKEIDVESRMKLRLSSITFPESPAAAVRLLAEFSGVPIDFDLENFELTRSSIESTLNLSLNDADVESALNELATLLKWNVLVGKDRITLVPKDADDALIEERFDLADLLNDSSRKAPIEFRGDAALSEEPLTLDVLSKMATTLVEPDSWSVNGEEGQGIASGEGTTLIVKQNALNRKKVGDLFERLRALRGLELKDSSTSNSLIAETLGWERLTKKISFNLLKPLTLQQAVEILERTQKIQVLWDDAVLNDFGVGRDVATVARVDDATIDQTLFDLLEPHKLTYVILGENLYLITTKEHAESYKTVEIHMFSSEKKELTEQEAIEFADEMKTAVSPKSWDDPDVSFWIDFQSECWIVRQSQPNQRAIRRWLEERR
ncbi:MAG: hypothetical protein IK077_03300 [Thermoguttaceae bacterium]|nr:hypothetical protein [Thermoguttaceae bacterium]